MLGATGVSDSVHPKIKARAVSMLPENLAPADLYRELRTVAEMYLDREAPGHTLQPTALVHEVFLRVCGPSSRSLSTADFFARATQCMRRVLIDHARRKKAVKRVADPGAAGALRMEGRAETGPNPIDVLAVDEAIKNLEALDGRAAQLVRLRFFAGLTVREAARVMDIGLATAEEDWRIARAWLARWLGNSEARARISR